MDGEPAPQRLGAAEALREVPDCYTEILIKNGFTRGASSPCLFHHKEQDILTLVHGDDFMSAADPKDLNWLEGILRKDLAVKTELLGPASEVGRRHPL